MTNQLLDVSKKYQLEGFAQGRGSNGRFRAEFDLSTDGSIQGNILWGRKLDIIFPTLGRYEVLKTDRGIEDVLYLFDIDNRKKVATHLMRVSQVRAGNNILGLYDGAIRNFISAEQPSVLVSEFSIPRIHSIYEAMRQYSIHGDSLSARLSLAPQTPK
jgi:hypothetical protein